MKKSIKMITVGVITFGILTTGIFGVYKYNKAEQKKEIKTEIKSLKKQHEGAVATYEVYVAEYKLVEAKIAIGEADNSQLKEVEEKRVKSFDEVHEIYGKIEKLESELKK